MPPNKSSFDLIKLLLVFSLALFSFVGGILAVVFEYPPYTLFREAGVASAALVQDHRERKEEARETEKAVKEYRDPVTVPTVHNYAGVDGDELILIGGERNYLQTEHESGRMAWLMDRRGEIQHVWNYDPEIWSDLKKVSAVPGVSVIYPVCFHLYKDGGLLVNFQGRPCFPFSIGIARYDRDSNLLWKNEDFSHHWFTVAEDGRIFVPALHVSEPPIALGKTAAHISKKDRKILDDMVRILDPDGNVLEEISMLEALFDSGLEGLLQKKEENNVKTDDPTHLNDVRLVTAEVAEAVPWLNAGDLLVSFRHLNTVGILDAVTRRFKWTTTGSTMRQHSPRFYHNGILMVDNLGGDTALGGTQIVHVDFSRGLPRTVFPLSAESMPDKCYTKGSGHLDLHRDGKRALFATALQGVVWEIDLQDGRVLWEYIHAIQHEQGVRRMVLTAKYVYNSTFPLNREKSVD